LVSAEQLNDLDIDELEATLLGMMYEKAAEDFYTFVVMFAPQVLGVPFVDGQHIRLLCRALQKAYETPNARLMISLPPRSMKSILGNVLFPAWCFGKAPHWQVLSISHSTDHAGDWGREVRNLIESAEYQQVFPRTVVDPANRSALKWATTLKGKYHAAGAAKSIAGKGANLGLVDDILSEQTAYQKVIREQVKKWWGPGFRTRIQPNGRIVMIGTRWLDDDIMGWLLDMSAQGNVDKWEVINIPAIIDGKDGPELWSLERMERTRDDPAMYKSKWNALYMGNPTPEEGVMIQPEHFKWWPLSKPLPRFDYVIITADTAFTDKTTNDYSALQCWGIFREDFTDSRGKQFLVPSIFLVAAKRGHWQYPELLEEIRRLIKKYNPDNVIVENKASGQVLIPDLIRSGVFVTPYTPGRGNDKVSRVQASLRFFEGGRVYVPEDRRWAQELVDEATSFPYGKNDDQVDAMTIALLYLRDAAHLQVQDYTREEADDNPNTQKRRGYWR
jgi:predicted phage terminase large subunit-like protein